MVHHGHRRTCQINKEALKGLTVCRLFTASRTTDTTSSSTDTASYD